MSKFNISHFLSTLRNSYYEPLLHSLENEVDARISDNDEKKLSVRAMVSQIREIIISLVSETSLLQSEKRTLALNDSRIEHIMDIDTS